MAYSTAASTIAFRPASADEIISLRHEILRPGLPREDAVYAEDADPRTRHFGAFDDDGRPVCCATFLSNSRAGAPAWQLRGMATSESLVRRGLGSRLLACAEESLRNEPTAQTALTLWANAREGAMPFYLKLGWRQEGELFDVPGVGPHFVLVKELPL
ncbi:acyl-CoA N-acyltransferase [Pavlovales sp. CCMP2436]|nr:acyl-CoA N-acyltransferase [Pavlovales sp. CCMP2436]|mmetsp:Transcript_33335/g.83097  ORF Transcript_33335/g.83097 Transcript_33335/m.83097 type:complete len:158 (-) Transcript_33335:154-627(-)|eukprot:CAMPEP_0179883766 /NCGR_PEP_ID=MMETSP0982-20121206/28916_1 /TAXON_ID=483367 /ORGANISM="non described non described, Strain CCMP 2436" /LENGTH=157 /DNA_ID=CAMNT_0021778289 /DNA_START=59 /DNA_END=532 /DNA_ORIENTATION=+